MSDKQKVEGCVASAAGPAAAPETTKSEAKTNHIEEKKMSVSVGKAAPDFEATAYHEGGFKNIKLSDFKGQWVFLCFYPGDFTFV